VAVVRGRRHPRHRRDSPPAARALVGLTAQLCVDRDSTPNATDEASARKVGPVICLSSSSETPTQRPHRVRCRERAMAPIPSSRSRHDQPTPRHLPPRSARQGGLPLLLRHLRRGPLRPALPAGRRPACRISSPSSSTWTASFSTAARTDSATAPEIAATTLREQSRLMA